MNIVEESKSYTYMTKEELLKEADKLIANEDKFVKDFGKSLKKALLTGFSKLKDYITAINVVLLVGGPVALTCIGAITCSLLFMLNSIPTVIIVAVLEEQSRFLDRSVKKVDDSIKKYRKLSSEIRKGHVFITQESVSIVTEAPKENEELAPEGDDMTDYTDNAAEDERVEADAAETPEDNAEPAEEEVPTDYTEDVDEDEPAEEETPEEDPADEEEPAPEDETGEGDTVEDETTDYTEDAGEEGGGDTGEEDGTDDDTTADDTTMDDTAAEDGETENTIVKNYNLMRKFKELYTTTSDILTSLGSVIYNQSIQNQVLDRGIDNIRKINEYVINYIEMSFSDKYEDNLYHYNIFIQSLKLNLEMLKKNARLDTSNENN